MRTLCLRALLFLLTVAGVSSQSAAEPADRPLSTCLGMTVRADTVTPPAAATVFSASKVLDLVFDIYLKPTAAKVTDGLVQVEAITPTGHPYQRFDLPLAAPGKDKQRRLAGYPFPLRAQPPVTASYRALKAVRVVARLPVAGTVIVNNSLYGTWEATASIGKGKPCRVSFSIQP